MRGLFGAGLPDRLHEFDALLLQDALHAADRVALAVEQMPDAAQEVDVFRPVIAPAAAALHRLDLAEAALPKPKHVLRQIEVVGDLADGAKCVWRLVVQSRRFLVYGCSGMILSETRAVGFSDSGD